MDFYKKRLTALKKPFSLTDLGIWRREWFWIGLITLLGGMLRFLGIFHGVEDNLLYHPDSKITLYEAWPKYLGEDWLQGSYNGAFYNLLLAKTIGLMEKAIRFFGFYQWDWTLEKIALAGSLLGAVLGTLTIPIIFLLGRQAYQTGAGLIGAVFFSLCPLHTFHSHYPYRDVPMVFFLALALFFCLRTLKKPTLLNAVLAWLTALTTVGMKPAGLVIIVPLVVAVAFVLHRDWRRWPVLIPAALITALGLIFFSRGGISFRFTNFESLMNFLAANREGLFAGLVNTADLLTQWLGLPYLLLSLAGVGYGLWRRTPEDFLFLSLQITALLAAATYFWLDDRFLIFLLPVMAVMAGRLAAEAWRACFGKRILKTAVFSILAALALSAFINSLWEGILFTLPDTRAVSGKWFDAHFPREVRIAMEEYYPLGISQWPKASFIDSSQTLDQESARTDLLVTSSLMHERYFAVPERFQKELAFIRSLQKEKSPIKKFSLGSLGFIHPDITVYLSQGSNNRPAPLLFPRPYDSQWNSGLSFLNQGPFDRDDRTIEVEHGSKYAATLVSPKTGQDMVVLALNGPEPSVLKIRVGYRTKIKNLKPGELDLITFRPKWLFPAKPALFPFEVGLPSGQRVLVQLRCGNREIGEALANWGQYERAVPYLKRASEEKDPYQDEILLLLGTVYKKLRLQAEARASLSRLAENSPHFMKLIRSLGRSDLPTGKWEASFHRLTQMPPELLRHALSREFEAEGLFPGSSGHIQPDSRASKEQGVAFDTGRHRPGEVLSGPSLYLPQGAYQADFCLRPGKAGEPGVLAEIRVWADDRLVTAFSVGTRDLSGALTCRNVSVPFGHDDQRSRIKFQVLATGRAGFFIDKIRIAPDIRKILEKKSLDLDAIQSD